MKRKFALFLVLVSGLAAFASRAWPFDIKSEAMGGVRVPGGENGLEWMANPASIVFRRKPSLFSASLGWSGAIDGDAFARRLPNPLLQEPLAQLDLRFSGDNAALGITLANFLDLNGYGPDGSWGDYNAYNLATVLLTAGARKEDFGFGFSIRGGKKFQRTHIRIDGSSTLADYVMQTTLERYQPSPGSEFFSASLGVEGKVGGFFLGLSFDDLARVDESGNITVSPTAMLQTMRLGVHYRGERYDSKTTGLLFIVPSAGLEIQDAFYDFFNSIGGGVVLPAAGDRERGSALSIGLELAFQLSSTFSVSLLSGVRSGPLGVGFLEKAQHSVGLSLRTGGAGLDLAAAIPFALYQGRSRRALFSLGGSWTF